MQDQALIDMAVLAGEIMLASGAEVYRVEDTVRRILEQSGFENAEVFALATGIFATLSDPSYETITVIKRVSRHSTNLNRIYRVNHVSRQFCNGAMTVAEAAAELKEIAAAVEYGTAYKHIGYIMTAAFFAIMFHGSALDCLAAGAVGFVLSLVVSAAAKIRLNSFCQNVSGSFALAFTALLIRQMLYAGLNLDAVIISAIMPMVPGVTFTTAIRDTLNGDYSSGVARIAEAVVVAMAVSVGVGTAMVGFRMIGGGI